MAPTKIKTRYCWVCGEQMGAGAYYDEFSTCGDPACEEEAQDEAKEAESLRDEVER